MSGSRGLPFERKYASQNCLMLDFRKKQILKTPTNKALTIFKTLGD
jgi:hypothetical protein